MFYKYLLLSVLTTGVYCFGAADKTSKDIQADLEKASSKYQNQGLRI